MYITFKNNSTSETMVVCAEEQKLTIAPQTSAKIFCQSNKIVFEAQTTAIEEFEGKINDIDDNDKNDSLKDRILTKLFKKVAKKLPSVILDTAVKYEIEFTDCQNPVVNLFDSEYSVCDGKFAEFWDMIPIGFIFTRAECMSGEIRVIDTTAINRKKFLKLMRSLLLFAHWGIFLDLFLFIPDYLTIRFLSSHFFIKRLFINLYKKPVSKRGEILYKKSQRNENMLNEGGCLPAIIKGLIFLLIIGGICWWAVTSEPEVIISEDFSLITCFDETYVKIEGSLPADAEKTFLGEYSAYYTLPDGGYDMDNYYCYTYETPDGTRYIWLKDNCTDKENANKDYEDYKNPLVYKIIE